MKNDTAEKGKQGLDARIEKEAVTNKGGTIWLDRKTKLESCIAQKKRVMASKKSKKSKKST